MSLLLPKSPVKMLNPAALSSLLPLLSLLRPFRSGAASKHLLSANKVYPLSFFDSSPSTTCVR